MGMNSIAELADRIDVMLVHQGREPLDDVRRHFEEGGDIRNGCAIVNQRRNASNSSAGCMRSRRAFFRKTGFRGVYRDLKQITGDAGIFGKRALLGETTRASSRRPPATTANLPRFSARTMRGCKSPCAATQRPGTLLPIFIR
jgi:hypothetical protein